MRHALLLGFTAVLISMTIAFPAAGKSSDIRLYDLKIDANAKELKVPIGAKRRLDQSGSYESKDA